MTSRSTRALRVLFVNGTAFGGSLMSTRSLAASLVDIGHDAALLTWRPDEPSISWLHKRLENACARSAGTPLQSATDWLARRPGRCLHQIEEPPSHAWNSPVPANALGQALTKFEADVVVTASISRPQWRQIRGDLKRRGIPSVLYLREDTALTHLTRSGAAPDLLVANSAALAKACEIAGYSAEVVPSIVDLSAVAIESSRNCVLVVNPHPGYGGQLALDIADLCPEIAFVFQESWREASTPKEVANRAAALKNVTVRPFSDEPAKVYRDAGLLLVPYPLALSSARPRTVLEAESNGIPVLASDLSGLREIAGLGAEFVDAEAGAEVWSAHLRSLWKDAPRLTALGARAITRVEEPDVDPLKLTSKFASLMEKLVASWREAEQTRLRGSR